MGENQAVCLWWDTAYPKTPTCGALAVRGQGLLVHSTACLKDKAGWPLGLWVGAAVATSLPKYDPRPCWTPDTVFTQIVLVLMKTQELEIEKKKLINPGTVEGPSADLIPHFFPITKPCQYPPPTPVPPSVFLLLYLTSSVFQ